MNAVQRIAAQTHQENVTLAELSRKSRTDAKVLKLLTVIATMYLPATLTAVSAIGHHIVERSTATHSSTF
jgi:hypothetical protein